MPVTTPDPATATARPEPLAAVDALTRLGGIADTSAVVALSSRQRVRSAIGRGELVRVGRNRLALPVADHGRRAAREFNGVASHLTAALHHGWKVRFPPDLPHVTVPRHRIVPTEPLTLPELFVRDLPAHDRDGWATSRLRTVIDCARDLPFVDALCVADSALRAGDVTQAELVEAARGIRGPAGERVRRVAEHANSKAANPFESALRGLALLAGLDLIPQFEVTCGDLELHPDLANPLLQLAVEADSYEFHGREPQDHNNDCFRYNALVVAGWDVLRFTWEQVMHSPDYVVTTLQRWLKQHLDAA